MSRLPEAIATSAWAERARIAFLAVTSLGPALLALRGRIQGREAAGGQLKTATDLAAEGWVLGFLRSAFPDDPVLAEEDFEASGARPQGNRYWAVDALDGTRSYVDGYDGFCCQVAFVDEARPVLAAIAEPVAGCCFVAVAGCGAFRIDANETTRLHIGESRTPVRFVDSVRPGGRVGELMRETGAEFVECGSVGLKICRVAEGRADVFAKEFAFKLWDVAPGDLVLREAGGELCDWNGQPIAYDGELRGSRILCARSTARWVALLNEASDG